MCHIGSTRGDNESVSMLSQFSNGGSDDYLEIQMAVKTVERLRVRSKCEGHISYSPIRNNGWTAWRRAAPTTERQRRQRQQIGLWKNIIDSSPFRVHNKIVCFKAIRDHIKICTLYTVTVLLNLQTNFRFTLIKTE